MPHVAWAREPPTGTARASLAQWTRRRASIRRYGGLVSPQGCGGGYTRVQEVQRGGAMATRQTSFSGCIEVYTQA